MSRFILLVFVWGIFSCVSSETQPRPEAGYAYLPLQIGKYIEYSIRETRYALTNAPETRTFQARETIREKYTDASGQIVYRIEHALREGNTWKVDSVCTRWQTLDAAFQSANGLTYVKLEFPVFKGKSWDGNRFNRLEKQVYEITEAEQRSQIGTFVFDKTLTVVHQNDSTLLSRRKKQEQYAEGVGLISWEETSLQYCGTPQCLGQGIIESGYSRIGSITNYGQ